MRKREESILIHKIHLWKILYSPKEVFKELHRADEVEGWLSQFIVLLFVSGFLSSLNFYAVIMSKHTSSQDLEKMGFSQLNVQEIALFLSFTFMIVSIVTIIVSIGVFTSILSLFFKEVGFKIIFIIVLYSVTTGVVHLLLELPLIFLLDYNPLEYSFYSLAYVIQDYTDSLFLPIFLNYLSIFTIWGLVILYLGLREFSRKSNVIIATIIITVSLVLIFFMTKLDIRAMTSS